MKRIIAALLALITLLTASAFAESANWVDIEMLDMTVSIPEDLQGYVSDICEAGVPFAVFYEDYDQYSIFNKHLTFSCAGDYYDLNTIELDAFVDGVFEGAVESLEVQGIKVDTPVLIDADFDSQDGREAIFISYATYVDYSALGYDLAFNMFTVQMVMPHAESGDTYVVTINTDNPEESEILFRIADSIRWN